ncbi:protein-disulfide reductase DsbD domain-containing protein [Algirhabdus cladophorae]|uniref:protein-disulfide reductase DsbD domain-containing protein n=1 Tax=Algirhabdus cladophorae TaxID=3377108 RepID=UPI003B849F32
MRHSFAFAALVASIAALTAAADPADAVRLDILPGWENADGTQMAGLRVSLDDGWKTYWRAPGDAGIPPVFSWNGSENVRGVSFHWPVPEVHSQNGMRTFGYQGEFTIPVTVHRSADGTARLKGKVQIGVCSDICVPVTLRFDQLLPEGGARDGQIASALVDQPMTAKEGRVAAATCAFDPTSDGAHLTVKVQMPQLAEMELAVIEAGDPRIWVAEPVVERQGDWLVAQTRMYHDYDGPMVINRGSMRITVLGAGQAVDIQGCSGS